MLAPLIRVWFSLACSLYIFNASSPSFSLQPCSKHLLRRSKSVILHLTPPNPVYPMWLVKKTALFPLQAPKMHLLPAGVSLQSSLLESDDKQASKPVYYPHKVRLQAVTHGWRLGRAPFLMTCNPVIVCTRGVDGNRCAVRTSSKQQRQLSSYRMQTVPTRISSRCRLPLCFSKLCFQSRNLSCKAIYQPDNIHPRIQKASPFFLATISSVSSLTHSQ